MVVVSALVASLGRAWGASWRMVTKPKPERNFQEHIDALRDVPSVVTLRSAFATSLQNLGVRWFGYNGVRLPRTDRSDPVIVHTFPREWERHYIANRYYEDDAIVRASFRNFLPYRWDTLTLSAKQQRIMNEAAEFKITSGLTVPIHGPSGEFARLSVATELPPGEFERVLNESRHHIHVMSLYYHAMISDMFAPDHNVAAIELSPREAEVLLWTSEGKTAWEIGEILGIAERTVVFHIENAKQKLGVFNKNQAVVKAIMLGLLKP